MPLHTTLKRPGYGESRERMRKLGVIVNPIAGMGGRVGLKGSDGEETLRRARARGARPDASRRATQALKAIGSLKTTIRVIACAGEMGADACHDAGIPATVTGTIQAGRTRAADTQAAARQMLSMGVDLLMFAGGDGTARDICKAVGERVPVIGVPAGVKIHSGVFAVTPRSAGYVAGEFLEKPAMGCRSAEVMDIDEDAFRLGRVVAKLYGTLCVPQSGVHIQSVKTGGIRSEKAVLRQISQCVIDTMDRSDSYFIIGPGTTTRSIMEMLGLDNTLLGVDVVQHRRLIAKDVGEDRLVELVKTKPAKIVVTMIGGQGHLFGRGNQQISPAVIRTVGKQNIIIVGTPEKLLGLKGKPLLVDTGDAALDRELEGYVRVVTGIDNTTIYRVGLAYGEGGDQPLP
ncbi:ATP-NAD kinase family protein [Desulfosarcina ovata]|uniref:ATP-NAD kinase n=2 Tax=Desulfosarcina ovata TaxID=83564 RepID=A0A5K8A4I2_9BACT|nr:ATP-NAD kinase family protein [Desulfosarcina ovata]BBO79895.1 ATP-NAD kinase [Desulfosarcina ovata subsp. sediminis]BBO87200.1 ATP-NAD kinase [Desulfosarcina ovata subsp. ovata]